MSRTGFLSNDEKLAYAIGDILLSESFKMACESFEGIKDPIVSKAVELLQAEGYVFSPEKSIGGSTLSYAYLKKDSETALIVYDGDGTEVAPPNIARKWEESHKGCQYAAEYIDEKLGLGIKQKILQDGPR